MLRTGYLAGGALQAVKADTVLIGTELCIGPPASARAYLEPLAAVLTLSHGSPARKVLDSLQPQRIQQRSGAKAELEIFAPRIEFERDLHFGKWVDLQAGEDRGAARAVKQPRQRRPPR